jgi:2-C-methyl-D-erythritol 2,4-cyclodiphosphate synthase
VRVGIGFDVHRLVEGRDLVLGGVKIEHYKGLLGHSDGDVLLHSICDAMLGAVALGDIGKFFPDTDIKYKGISSIVLLETTWDLLKNEGYRVNNVDSTVVCENPRLFPHIPKMRENIANALELSVSAVSVKATTTELLGYVGRGEGIAVYSVVTVMEMV